MSSLVKVREQLASQGVDKQNVSHRKIKVLCKDFPKYVRPHVKSMNNS